MSASILVVDDDPQVVDVIERSLEQAGYSVHTASDGRQALAVIRSVDFEFDLILLDLVMPDMDGLELLRLLLKAKSKLKVIAMSGMFHGQFLRAAKQLGAVATIEKPISLDLLMRMVSEALTMESAT